MTVLQIVDFGSYVHSLINASPSRFTQKTLEEFVEYNVLSVLYGCIVEPLVTDPNETIQTVFCEDLKPYWRHPILYSRYGVNYKGNRGKDGKRVQNANDMGIAIKSYLKKIGLSTVRLLCSTFINKDDNGFEADDISAGVIRTFGSKYSKIYIFTVDTDYLPFTDDPRIVWCATSHHIPRVRTAKEALTWCKTAPQNTSSALKRQFPWETPKQLWEFKAKFGDTSDNIRGDKRDQSPGRYLPFIDLLNPLDGFRCWEEPNFKQIVENAMTKESSITNVSVFNLEYYIGQSIAINPYTEHIPIIALKQ